MRRERQKDIFIILFLLALVFIFFRKLINPHKIFLGIDLFEFYPLQEFLFSNIKKRILPLWDPYISCGSPTAGNLYTILGMFYPLNLIFLFLPLNISFNYSVVIHIFLSGLFMHILTKSLGIDRISALFSAITFIFSGAFIVSLASGMIDLINGITWLPLIFFLFYKALRDNHYIYSILTGITLGLQGLSGHPQISLMTVYVLFFYLLYTAHKPIRLFFKFAIILLMAMGLYSVQMFPNLEVFLKYSMRSLNMGYIHAGTASLHPKQLLSFFMPHLFGDSVTEYYWGELCFDELNKYTGLLPLFLSLVAVLFVKNKHIKFYSALLIISILLALGSHSPIYQICYQFFPGFKLFKCPARWLFFSVFSLSILAGFGLSFLINNIKDKQDLKLLVKGLVAFNIIIIIGLYLDYFMNIGIISQLTKWVTISSFSKEINFQYRYLIVWESLINFTLLLSGITLCLVTFWKDKISLFMFKFLSLTILIFDLWIFGQRFIISVDNELYRASKQWDFFKNDRTFYRVFVEPPISDLSASSNESFALGSTNVCYDLLDYSRFKSRVKKFPQILNAKYLLTTHNIDTSDVKFIKSTAITMLDFPDYAKKFKIYDVPINIYRYKDFLPRTFIVHRIIVAKDEEDIFRVLNDVSFNPHELAVLEGEGFFLKMPLASKSFDEDIAEIVHYSPNRIRLKANLKQTGLLVLNEIFFPGWQVYVDGQKEHIFKTNYLMRSVYLKEGSHTIEFIYRPLSFRIGTLITFLTMIILFSLGLNQFYLILKAKLSVSKYVKT